MEVLSRLQTWYLSQCDGEWEHNAGVTIETLDNPGWQVRSDLKGTALEKRKFKTVSQNVPPELIDQAMGKVQPPFIAAEPLVKDDWMERSCRYFGSGPGNEPSVRRCWRCRHPVRSSYL